MGNGNPRQTFDMRQRPKQRRSDVTVNSIRSAALQLLGEVSVADVTTERIAKRAGVGIGTLYDYFPNREAVFKALYEDVSINFSTGMKDFMRVIIDMPTDKAIARVMARLVRMHEKNQLVLIKLVDELPELKDAVRSLSPLVLVRNIVRAYLHTRNPDLSKRQVNRKAFLAQRIIMGCIQAYIIERPDQFTKKELIAELSMVVNCLVTTTAG